MKRVIALLAAAVVLAGSMEMTASAATNACHHFDTWKKVVNDSVETYTHSIQVGTSASGKPILAACLVEIGWRQNDIVCSGCGAVMDSKKEKLYEVHSMH